MTYFVKADHASTTIATVSTADLSITLQDAIKAMIGMNESVNAILNGQTSVSQDGIAKANAFVQACLDAPAKAYELVGYGDVKVAPQSPDAYRPYQYLLEQIEASMSKGNNVLASATSKNRRSQYVKIFQDAYDNGISVDDFKDVLIANGGVRPWYNKILAAEKAAKLAELGLDAANDNRDDQGDDVANDNRQGHGDPEPKAPKAPTAQDLVDNASRVALVAIDPSVFAASPKAQAMLQKMDGFLFVSDADSKACIDFLVANDSRIA